MNYAIIKVEWEENSPGGRAITAIGHELEEALKGQASYDNWVNHHWNAEKQEHQGTKLIITPLELHYDFRPLESKVKVEGPCVAPKPKTPRPKTPGPRV